MKPDIYKIIYFLFGVVFCIICAIVIHNTRLSLDLKISIIDTLSLIVTTVLSVLVYKLTSKGEVDNVARDLIADDIRSLCDLLSTNKEILSSYKSKQIDKETAIEKVVSVFSNSDLIIDTINEEFKESFPSFEKDLMKLTEPYQKWLTGGEFMQKDFNISDKFIEENNKEFIKVNKQLKIVIHQLLKE